MTNTSANFVNVGERTNVTGSAAFKKMIMAGDYTRAVLDLAARDLDRAGIVAGHDHLLERRRPGDVGALADVDEIDGGVGH